MKKRALFIVLALAAFQGVAQEEAVSPERALQIRERYEQVLTRTPMQDSAFDRVYKGYLEAEGVDAWVAKLKPAEGEPTKESWALLGRIEERQFKTDEAIASLEKAKALGLQDPQLDLLLGRLYYEDGQDDKAATLLTASLEQPIAPEARSNVVRILGNLYMREGKRDEAIAAWKRLADDSPGDTFAQTELAEIYEDNRMWDEAIAAYSQLADASTNDPYQKCRALRAIGRARVAMEAYPEAITAFEQALDLVSPGNWLFEDLKMRLVGVYQDLGDLQGLATYINEKLEASPGDTEFRDLLAETYTRMTKFAEAEAEHKKILERDPTRISTHEHLITLYERMERPDDVVATYETLIQQYPTEPDYLRRLGEVFLRRNQPDQAKATWRRLLEATPTAGQHAQLAEWMEMYEFAPEAMAEFEAALTMEPNREWTFKLAALKHAGGDGDAAKALWASLLKEDSPAAERAEVASIMENFKYIADAEPLLAQAHAQEPANLEFAQALAKNLVEQEKFDAALPLFEQMANQTESEYFQDRGEGGLLDAYGKLGILAEKKQAWEDAVRANPEDTGLLMRLARMYGRSGDNVAALGLYERCVELKPEDSGFAKALAEAYTRASRIEEAIELYHKLIAQDANRAGGYYRELLDIYLKSDFKDEAIETAKKVVELSPTDAEAYLSLGQVYMNYQQYDDGLAAYRGALRLSPDEPDYYRQYGQALQGQDRLGEAQDAYRKMLDTAKEDETRLQAVASLAQIHLREGKLESLLAEFQGRVRSTPKRLAAYEELAAIHVQAGDTARSLEVLENGFNSVDDKGAALKSLVRASFDAQDFEKVVRYFEELIALSGKASAFEYDRLGQVYAQLGDIDKARATWQRIVDEDKDNPKAYITLAKALRNAGFSEEAAAATEGALEKDPHNFMLRFEYAQELAGQEDMGKAYEQLQMLLDLGPSDADKEKDKKEAEKEKKVEQIQRTRLSYERVNMFSPNYRPSERYYYGGSPQRGTFEGIRPQVIATMAGMAENSVGIDEFIATYKKRVDENPGSQQALQDLILIYESCNKQTEAQAATEALAAIQPDNVDLLDKLAVQYSYTQQVDKALEKLARIDALQPTRKKSSDLARIYLLYRAEKKDEARAMLTSLVDNSSDDQYVLSIALNVAAQYGEKDTLTAMEGKLATLDPKLKKNFEQSLAYSLMQVGDTAKARAIFEEMLFGADDKDPYGYQIPRGRRVNIYTPRIGNNNNQNVFYGGGAYYQLQQRGIQSSIDYRRSSALEQLTKILDGAEKDALMQRVRDEAGAFATAEGSVARQRAWTFGQLLAMQYIGSTDYAKAREVLAPFIAGKLDDATACNLAIYLDEQEDKFDAMLESYSQLRAMYPGQIREILRAECSTLMLAGRHDEAAERIRELARRGAPPNDLVAMIQQLKAEEKPQLAKQLLEEQLSGLQRNAQALSMLAAIYAENNDYEKAMTLAREAWEGLARGNTGRNAYYYAYGGYYQSSGMSVDENLSNWFQYAKSAGKKDELIEEFKQRLEKQPTSVSAHEQLASLYSLDDEKDKAIDIYKSLLEKRPHFIKAATALAQLYEQAGKYQEALAQYESFIKSRPSLYSGMGWQIRNLYQRMGQGENLAKIEEDMVKQARTPDQLQNLAWQFRNDGEFEKARELYLKIIDMQPSQSYYRTQLGEVLREMGKDAEALEIYAKWFDSPVMRAQGYIDQGSLNQMVSQYKVAGRLAELKAKNEVTRIDKPDDVIAKSVDAHIAMAEHRFDEASALFMETMKTRQDGNTLQYLVNMGELQDRAVEVIEQLQKDGQMANYWDLRRIGQLYLAAGNREKAVEAYKKFAEQQGQWGLREVMQGLYDFGLYAEAEDFYLKNRKKTREMDSIAMNMYMEGNGLQGLVQEMLSQNIGEQSERLVDNIVRDEKTSYPQAIQVLTPLLEREPENKFLLGSIISLHEKNEKFEAALPWCEKLLAVDPHDMEARKRYARLLVKCKREADALKLFDNVLAEKLNNENASAAIDFYLIQGLVNRARTVRDQAAPVLDVKGLEQIDLRLTRHQATLGQARACADRLKATFAAAPDDKNFSACFQYLVEAGYLEEAWQFLLAQADSGLLNNRVIDQQAVPNAVVQYGQMDTFVELLWKFIRHGERWERENQVRQSVQGFQQLGQGRILVDALRDRALAENPAFAALLNPVVDAYQQLGDNLSALEATDALLALQPGRRENIARKANVLELMKRHDEALAILSSLPGAFDLETEAREATHIADNYLKAGREPEAFAAIDSLVAWNKTPAVAGQIGSALAAAKKFAEAIPYLEKGLRDSDSRMGKGSLLLNCYLETGNPEKALTLWRESKNQREFRELYQIMDKDLYRPVAREVLEARLQAFPAEWDGYRLLGRVLLKDGDMAGARELFKRALAAAPPTAVHQVASGFGQLLAAQDQLAPLLEAPPADDPMLVRALIAGYGSLPREKRTDSLRDKVLALPLEVKDLLSLADSLTADEEKPTAITLWQRALGMEKLEDTQRVQLYQQLWKAGALEDPAGKINALLQQNPALLRGDAHLLAFVARFPATEAFTTGMAELRTRMPEGDNVTFFDKLAAYHGGDPADLSGLRAFADTATLEEWQWRHLAELCRDVKNKDAEAAMLRHIAEGGFGTDNRDRALAEICVIDAEAGRIPEAFTGYQAISPAYGDREGLMETIAKHTTAEHIPGFQAAVDQAVTARPGNLLVPDWMGYVAQLAESAGAPIDLASWVSAASLTPVQKAEALQWAGLLEGWQVSPRSPVENTQSYMDEAQTRAALTPDGAPADLTGWTFIDPKQSLGLVDLGPVLFPKDNDFEDAGAMAYRVIDSAAGGPQDFAFASNIGNAEVWINGVRVLGAFNRNLVRPGLERFRIDLKPGTNHVVVKSTNNNKRWIFCLGTLEPRPPLALPVVASESAPPLAAAG